jgi:threonine dehydrogenase-like Zn-dependent dehydrogenase
MGSLVRFASPGVVEVVDDPSRPLGATEVRVRTLFSGISAGTELSSYRGTSPHLNKSWDAERRLFVEGNSEPSYPVTNAGYEEVGEVTELGADVTRLSLGDRIWGTWGHRSEAVLAEEFAAERILSPDADPRVGMFSHIGAIALNVVLDADIHVGETVAVFGLGVPGQIVAQLARLNGARVIVVDGIASRRELALELGADLALDPASGTVAEQIRALTGNRGADVCLEITGNYRALQEAIRSVAYSSRVVAAGFMQGEGIGLRLGEEFHHNRVQVVVSQISGVSPSLQHRWSRYRLARTAIDLGSNGTLRLTELISHTVPVEDAPQAYTMLDQRPNDALQVVLDFAGGVE